MLYVNKLGLRATPETHSVVVAGTSAVLGEGYWPPPSVDLNHLVNGYGMGIFLNGWKDEMFFLFSPKVY